MGAMLAILMQLYPGKTGQIVAWTGTASGLGHMIGKPIWRKLVRKLFVGHFFAKCWQIGQLQNVNEKYFLLV